MLGPADRRIVKSGQSVTTRVVHLSQESVVALLDELDARQTELGAAMASAIIREIQPMRAVTLHDPTFRRRFDAFCQQHVCTFLETTRRGRVAGPDDLGFVREVAERRADDAFPLPALMEGLRVGHRVLDQRIRQVGSGWNTPAASVLSLTTRLIEYMDAVGAELGQAYRSRQALGSGRADLLRREMLDDLLEGRYASRPDAAMLAASVGFEPDAQYEVSVLVAGEGGQQATHALATALNRAALDMTGFRFVVVRADEVVGVFRAADANAVVHQACTAAQPRARAGISTSCRGIGEVARGYWEAVRALRFTSEAEACVDLSRLGPMRYLEFNADSVARQLAVQYLGTLRSGPLADTLLVYVDCGLNARLTAQRMGVHLNTVHNRLERIADMLRQPRLGPVECVEAATALRIATFATRGQAGSA
jgi:PucR-like helix-turn-helix protein/diguanylate cyclase with GGDEF domain